LNIDIRKPVFATSEFTLLNQTLLFVSLNAMNKSIPANYIKIALILSLAISLTIHFSLMTIVFFEKGSGHRNDYFTFSFFVFEFVATIIVAITTFFLNYYLISPFDVRKKISFKRIIISLVFTFVAVTVLLFVFLSLRNVFNFNMNMHRHTEELFSRNYFGAAIAFVSLIIIHLLRLKKHMELENEKLRSESIQSQFESLKSQLSPHFLFNSLTALKTLIDDSPVQAKQYVNHLSQVLRYTLQRNRKQLVTLAEELEFTESYIFLLKIRYDTNLQISIKIADETKSWLLPPLTIQTLVENAVKHNEISNDFPLSISIETSECGLLVKNKIQQKMTPEEGAGIGLTNLSKLFRILDEKDIEISQNENAFTVQVPLFKP